MEKGKLYGRFDMVCRSADGSIKWRESFENLITRNGFDFMADVMFNSSRPSIMSHVAIGSGSTAAADSQTELVTELARESGVYAHTDNTKVSTLTATFAAGTGTGTIREVAVLNAAAAGTMLSRALLGAARTKAVADSLVVTYTFTLSQQ